MTLTAARDFLSTAKSERLRKRLKRGRSIILNLNTI